MKIPALPTLPDFSSDSVTKYFKLWELLKYERANPTKSLVRPSTWPIDDEYIVDNEDNEYALKALTSLLNLEQGERELILAEKQIVDNFFVDVVDQRAFWNDDHIRIRAFIEDWYTAQRTLVSKSRHAIDPYSLSSEELDDLILSFGFPHPYQLDKNDKATFLHALIGYYQHKGTPAALGEILTFFGLTDFVLNEWWVKKDPDILNLSMHSKPIWPATAVGNTDFVKVMSYIPFVASDPYWHYDKQSGPHAESLLAEYIDTTTDANNNVVTKNLITLPSITPYLSLNLDLNYNKIQWQTSVLNRTIQESFEWWIQYCLVYQGTTSDPTLLGDATTGDVYRWTRNVTHEDCVDSFGDLIEVATDKTTDIVWNGTEWVDLNCTLDDDLLAYNPADYGGVERYTPTRQWEVNIDDENSHSLLEVFIAAHYLHNHQYINGLKRYPPTPDDIDIMDDGEFYDSSNEIVVLQYERQLTRGYIDLEGYGIFDPVLATSSTTEEAKRPTVSLIVRVLETESDHVFSLQHNTWIDLQKYLEYKDEDGNMSAVVWLPPDPSENIWETNSLFYSGDYAPLDIAWYDSTGNIINEGLRDDTDDSTILYGEIEDEWDELSTRPTDEVDTTAQVGPNPDIITYPTWDGYEQHPVYSAWQKQKEQREDRLNAFYRGSDSTAYTNYPASYYLEPGRFLQAMDPDLYDAITLETYVLGITYTYSQTGLHKKKETLWNDLGWALNEIGLDALKSISFMMVGLAYWNTIKKIINFFKPYRARFRELLIDYIIDDPVDDGMYAEDNCFPSVNQYTNDPTYTDEALITTPILWFEEKHYNDIFEGQLRGFDEFVRSDVHLRLDDHVNMATMLDTNIVTVHTLLMNQSGPYDFDACRVEDALSVQIGEVLFWNEEDIDPPASATVTADQLWELTDNPIMSWDSTNEYFLVDYDTTGECAFLVLLTDVNVSTLIGDNPFTGDVKLSFKVGENLPTLSSINIIALTDGGPIGVPDYSYTGETSYDIEIVDSFVDLIAFIIFVGHGADTDVSEVKLVTYDTDL